MAVLANCSDEGTVLGSSSCCTVPPGSMGAAAWGGASGAGRDDGEREVTGEQGAGAVAAAGEEGRGVSGQGGRVRRRESTRLSARGGREGGGGRWGDGNGSEGLGFGRAGDGASGRGGGVLARELGGGRGHLQK
jgi:hypothetical protein